MALIKTRLQLFFTISPLLLEALELSIQHKLRRRKDLFCGLQPRSVTCCGASQSGSLPPLFSSNSAHVLSSEPNTERARMQVLPSGMLKKGPVHCLPNESDNLRSMLAKIPGRTSFSKAKRTPMFSNACWKSGPLLGASARN